MSYACNSFRKINWIVNINNDLHIVPGDGGSQVEAKLNKSSVVHYICEKTSSEFFNIWLNLELLVPVVIDCWVCIINCK